MSDNGDTQGGRIRALFENIEADVSIIAPFIKVDALQLLLQALPVGAYLTCITRWLPREVAAGVSDPEILDVLEERGNFSLFLVERLHAKIYIAGNRCLAGSPNVTLAGMGEGGGAKNIEILVETKIDDPSIVATLREIEQEKRPATKAMVQTVLRLANSLSASKAVNLDAPWFPSSRQAKQAYRFYTQPSDEDEYVGSADRILLADLARANLQPGLKEEEFRAAIRSLLETIPIAEIILNTTEDKIFTHADTHHHFEELEELAGGHFSANDLWLAFVEWMAYFFPDKVMAQEITQIALRRAQILKL